MKNCCQKSKKSTYYKCTYKHSDNDYKTAMLSKSYLIVIRITMQSLKTKVQF